MRSLAALLVCVAALAAPPPSGAQDGGRLPFALLGPDQGLPSAGIISITQDSDGFIWFGTEKGLIRYDGGRGRTWGSGDGLPSAYVSRVLPAKGGGVWVGTLAGLLRLEGNTFERMAFGTGQPDTAATQIAVDASGRLWVVTGQGLFVQSAGGKFEAVPAKGERRVSAIALGRRTGTMYLATERGIEEFTQSGPARVSGPADGLPAEGLLVIAEDGDGRVWSGGRKTLVAREPGAARFTDRSDLLPASLSPNSTPLVDSDGSVWLPTQAGALHLVGGRRAEVLGTASGLPFRWVRSLFRDREGTLWVLGPSVARLLGGGKVRNYTLSHEASGEVVWAIVRDRRGHLLVGTDDGAARFGSSGLERIPGTEGRRVKGLAVDRGGTTWMVSTVGPALWLRPGSTVASEAPLGDLGRGVNCVKEDSAGRLWFGHAQLGIVRWDPQARRAVQEVGPSFTSTPTLAAFCFREDGAGRLWVGTSVGLLIREPDGKWKAFGERDGLRARWVRGLALLPDGTAWLHYQEPVGLTRVRLDGDRLSVLEQRSKGSRLRSDMVYAVEADGRGQVWVSTEQGLDRLDPPLHVGQQDGMVSEDCAIEALLADGDRIWVGTAGGLVAYDTTAAAPPPAPLRAHVVQVAYGGRRVEPPFLAMAPVRHEDATVEFRVAAPSYLNEHSVRLQVRLVGLENQWRDEPSKVAYYPALAGGKYRFEARAAAGEASFGPVASIDIVVLPPWWRTWWVYALELLAAAGVVAGLVSLRMRSLSRSKTALEALVNARTAELQARNTELSAALGEVKTLSGLLPMCANCRKLRDDKGYWSELETYITKHTDAQFSHGICPDCMKALYPDLT